jgi:hypothetical protein
MHRMLAIALAIGFASVAPLACGDDTDEGDCVSLCEDAQARDCTSITGDCGAFCDAVFSVEDRAGCADERLDYHECLNAEGVCGGACSGSENDLETCLGTYCLGHSGEDECQVLMSSF